MFLSFCAFIIGELESSPLVEWNTVAECGTRRQAHPGGAPHGPGTARSPARPGAPPGPPAKAPLPRRRGHGVDRGVAHHHTAPAPGALTPAEADRDQRDAARLGVASVAAGEGDNIVWCHETRVLT